MSLKISYRELQREVGRFLGFSRNPDDWVDTQPQDVDDIIKAGQRHFYWPPVIEGMPSHIWSFLCSLATINLVSGERSFPLPADFVRPRSDFVFGHSSGGLRMERIPEADIRSLWSRSEQSGIPRYCAIRSAGNPNVDGYELLVYPVPEIDYSIDFMYERSPHEITVDNPYHLGAASHSELLLSACLMVADKMLNSESISPDGGIHAQRFFRQLTASIVVDIQSSQ
jgi:hypothetical protein